MMALLRLFTVFTINNDIIENFDGALGSLHSEDMKLLENRKSTLKLEKETGAGTSTTHNIWAIRSTIHYQSLATATFSDTWVSTSTN